MRNPRDYGWLARNETAAPAGPRNGGEDGHGQFKPFMQSYGILGGWIKPDLPPNRVKLSTAIAFALDLGRMR
jgi:hypothetical protein